MNWSSDTGWSPRRALTLGATALAVGLHFVIPIRLRRKESITQRSLDGVYPAVGGARDDKGNMNNHNYPKGQTLIEVAAVMGIAVIVVAALVGLGLTAMRSSGYAKSRALATELANEAIEAMRIRRDSSTDFGSDFTNGCYLLSLSHRITGLAVNCTAQDYGTTGLKYIITVSDAENPDGKKVVALVRFSDSAGDHDTVVSTILTEWQ